MALAAPPLETVRLQLKWLHQYQFAGYYAAIEQGLYRQAGLKVELLESTGTPDPIDQLVSGKADYAITDSSILAARADNKPVVALAAILQHSPLSLLVKESSGITRPEDLRGKRIMIGLGLQDAAILAMLKKAGLSTDDYIRQESSFNPKALLNDETDALTSYVSNEGFLLQEQGVAYRYLMPALYGVDFYGDLLVTTEQEIATHPQRVERFRRATLEGWTYALSHTEEMIDLILKKYNTQHKSRAHLLFEAQKMSELIQPLMIKLGYMNQGRWSQIQDALYESGSLNQKIDLTKLLYQPPNERNENDVLLTPAENKWIAEHPLIRGGIDPDWMPIEYVDPQGRHQGISADLVTAIRDHSNLNIQITPNLSWSEVVTHAERGELDLLPAVVETEDRRKFLRFSKPYIYINWAIISLVDHPPFNSLEALAGIPTAVTDGYASHNRLKREWSKIPLRPKPNVLETLQALVNGEVKAAVVDLDTATRFIHAYHFDQIKVDSWVFKNKDGLSIGVRKDWPELVTIINKIIDHIGSDEIKRIEMKWKAVPIQLGIQREDVVRMVIWIVSIATLVLLLFLFWNRRLAHEVIARKESERRFRDLFELSPDPVWIIDNSVFIECNQAAVTLLGYPSREQLTHTHPSKLSPEFQPDGETSYDKAERMIALTLAQGVHRFEWVHTRYNGSNFWAEVTLSTYESDHHTQIYCVWRDITLSKEQKQALIESRNIAERASQAKDEFLASMSHELRTPLTSIIGNSEMLIEECSHDCPYPERSDLLRTIRLSGSNQLTLVNDILDISKIESGKFTIEQIPYDFTLLIDELKRTFTPLALEKGIGFTLEQQNREPKQLIGDRHRINQILFNLIGNAIKFTDVGAVTITSSVEQGRLRFRVEDSGIGIPPETQQRLFNRFEQADFSISRRFGGSGLGLYISKNLAQAMGGTIDCTSVEGKGSTFVLELPYQQSELAPVVQQSAKVDRGAQQPCSGEVLVAEDTPELQLLVRRILEKTGLTVTLAGNGEEAVRLEQENHFDLILMDMQMPVMDGIEATKQIRARGSLVPIIALTANVMPKHRETFHAAGGDGFLGKPINRPELNRLLNHYLQCNNPAHP